MICPAAAPQSRWDAGARPPAINLLAHPYQRNASPAGSDQIHLTLWGVTSRAADA